MRLEKAEDTKKGVPFCSTQLLVGSLPRSAPAHLPLLPTPPSHIVANAPIWLMIF